MPRFSALLPAVFVGLVLPGCNPDETTSDAETSAGATSTSSSTGTSTASASDPSLGTSSGTDAGSTSSAGADPSTTGAEEDASTSTADAEASSTGAAVAGDGICGLRSEADVTEDGYAGWEEYYLIGDEGLGDPLCVIRFRVERVGEAAPGCPDCLWSHRVRRTFEAVVVDEDGVCAGSDLGLDEDALAELDGTEFDYGYVVEYTGHNDVLMGYDAASETWSARHFARWDDTTALLTFDRRDGFCTY